MKRFEIPRRGELRIEGRNWQIPGKFQDSLSAKYGPESFIVTRFIPYIRFKLTTPVEESQETTSAPIATSNGVPLYRREEYHCSLQSFPLILVNFSDSSSIFVTLSVVFPFFRDSSESSQWLNSFRFKVLEHVKFTVSESSAEQEILAPLSTHLYTLDRHPMTLRHDENTENCCDFLSQPCSLQQAKKILIVGQNNQFLHSIARYLINIGLFWDNLSSMFVDLDLDFCEAWEDPISAKREYHIHQFFPFSISARSFSPFSKNEDKTSDEIHLLVPEKANYAHTVFHLSKLLKSRERNASKRKKNCNGISQENNLRTFVVLPVDLCDLIEESRCAIEAPMLHFDHADVNSRAKLFAAVLKWFEIDTVLYCGPDFGAHCLFETMARYTSEKCVNFLSCSPISAKFDKTGVTFVSLPSILSTANFSVFKSSQRAQEDRFQLSYFKAMAKDLSRHSLNRNHDKDSQAAKLIESSKEIHVSTGLVRLGKESPVKDSTALHRYLYQFIRPQGISNVSQETSLGSSWHDSMREQTIEIESMKFRRFLVTLAQTAMGSIDVTGNNEFRDFVLPFADAESAPRANKQSSVKEKPKIHVKKCLSDPEELISQCFFILTTESPGSAEEVKSENSFTLSTEILGFGYILSHVDASMKVRIATPLSSTVFDQNNFFLLNSFCRR